MTDPALNIISIPGFTDPFSSMTHLLAALAYLFLPIFLLRKGRGDRKRMIYLGVFSFACFFQFSMSGAYHILDYHAGRKILQILDHAAIFTLIAASFTAVHGILFRRFWRWGFLFLVWAIAITGITLKSIYFDSVPEWLSLALYLGLGWLGMFTAIMVVMRFGLHYNKLLFYSGASYTIGAVLEFVRAPILIAGVIGPHELFHIAVIAGVSFQWAYVYRFADGFVTLETKEVLHMPESWAAEKPYDI